MGTSSPFLIAFLVFSTSAVSAFEYGVNPNAILELSSNQIEQSPEHRLIFDVSEDELETYRAVIRYPAGFRFNRFDSLGPLNTPIGQYQLDFNFDGAADHTVELRSLDPDSAYADVIADQQFSPSFEPLLMHTFGPDTGPEFQLRLPFGGDADPRTLTAAYDVQMRLVLFAQLISNPAASGDYNVTAFLTSVDPDSDGTDDFEGDTPLQFDLTVPVSIENPIPLPFSRFTIERAKLFINRHSRGNFIAKGRYKPDPGGNGLDLGHDDVSLTIGPFSQTIPGASFRIKPKGAKFKNFKFKRFHSGVMQLSLYQNGRFFIHARRLNLPGLQPGEPVSFALKIGDDLGETSIAFDAFGHYPSKSRTIRDLLNALFDF